MKPVDLSKASGVLMYSVVNRGNGTATASAEGHISLVSGWQGDVVPTATNQTIQVPRAKNPDGSSITGPLVVRILDQSGTTAAADDSARDAVAVSAGDARHDEGDAGVGGVGKRRGRQVRRGEDREHRLGVRDRARARRFPARRIPRASA